MKGDDVNGEGTGEVEIHGSQVTEEQAAARAGHDQAGQVGPGAISGTGKAEEAEPAETVSASGDGRPQETERLDDNKAESSEDEPTNGEACESPSLSTVDLGALKRLHRVSIASIGQVGQVGPGAINGTGKAEEAEPVTLEKLSQYWDEMLHAMEGEFPTLAQHLKGLNLRLEEEDMFVVEVESNYAESEIKPYLLRILTYLRSKTGRPMLNCRLEIVTPEQDAVAYLPRDKYEIMLESNPALAKLHVYFPEIDF